MSPTAYSALLSKWLGGGRWLGGGKWLGGRGPTASEWAFRQIRALRQWLRTACSTGESRDIVFALKGFQELLNHYCAEARLEKGTSLNEKLRDEPPAEYSLTDEIVNSRWRGLLDPSVPPKGASLTGWFGDEFGRALARCAEVGIRSEMLLRRDLDRLLVLLGGATLQLAGLRRSGEEGIGSAKTALSEEAGFLLDRIAEIYGQKIQFFVNPQYNFERDSSNSGWTIFVGLTLLVPEA